MITWINIEYLVANAFICSIKNNNLRFLKIDKIFNYQRVLFNYWKQNNIDALVVGSLSEISTKYNEWFNVISSANLIILNNNITVEMLENKFVISDDIIQESLLINANALF